MKTFRLIENIKGHRGYTQAGDEFAEFRTTVITEWTEGMDFKHSKRFLKILINLMPTKELMNRSAFEYERNDERHEPTKLM